MPNVLLTASSDPTSLKSGGTTTLSFTYESYQPGDIEVRCSAPFDIDPKSVSAPPSATGSASLKVTVKRIGTGGPVTCDIVCTFLESPSLDIDVDVT